MLSNTGVQDGTVSAGSSFDTTTLTLPTGTVYKLTIEKESDEFPTYKYNSTPGDKEEYIWPHKGGI